jgi:hypothetical protein
MSRLGHVHKEVTMAGLMAAAHTDGDVQVTSSGKTKLAYRAPSDSGVRVKRVQLSFDGTSPTDAKAVVIIRHGKTTANGTSSSGTLQKLSGHTGAVRGSATKDYSAEPTWDTGYPVVDARHLVHTQSGLVLPLDVMLNPGEIITIWSSSATTRNMNASFDVEE